MTKPYTYALLRPSGYCAAVLLFGASTPTTATEVSGSLSAGVEYDSNVAVEEADLNTRQGDAALLLSGSLELELVDSDNFTFGLSYDFDQTRHEELTDYNLLIQGISGSTTLALGDSVIGFDARYRRALLGGEDYLGLLSISPSITRRLGSQLVVRAAYTGQQKQFLTSSRLDAWNDQAQLDFYRYFAGRRGVFVLSLRHDREDAAAEELDYRAWQAGLRVQAPISLGNYATRIRLGYAYSERDYRAVTPSIGEERKEHRSTLSAGWDFPLEKGLTLRPSARLVDRDSNLPSADYTEEVVATELEYRF